MPIDYKIYEDKKLVLATGHGVITAAEVIAHLDAVAADERYQSPMKKLVDYRDVENIEGSINEQRAIAWKKKQHHERFAGEKCAFVSPKDVIFGTTRMHESLVNETDYNMNVFRNIDDALAWLDVTLDETGE